MQLHEELAYLYFELEEPAAALSEVKEVIRLDPTNGDKYADLGFLYEELDSLEQAVSSYKNGLSLGLRNKYRNRYLIQCNLARLYNLLEMYPEQ